MLCIHPVPDSQRATLSCLPRVTVSDIPVPLGFCRVSAVPYNTAWPGCQRPIDQTEEAAFLSFESDGAVTLGLDYPDGISEVTVRPLSRGASVRMSGRHVSVTLPRAGCYTVEADGFRHAVHVFFNPVRDFSREGTGDRTVIRYRAGVHHIGHTEIGSDTTVIVDAGAYLFGSITAIGASHVTVCGYGVIDGSSETRSSGEYLLPRRYDGPILPETDVAISDASCETLRRFLRDLPSLHGILRFYHCSDVRVEGVTLRDAASFALIPAACRDVVIENVKTVGMWRYNSDGIDLFNCQRTVIRNCFLRDFDDCVVIKGICGFDALDNSDILVEGCVIWCDWGRCLEIGAETNAPEYKNITFRDCDCIHGSTVMLDIQHHNRAKIHDITFSDIRAEYTKYQLSDVYQSDMSRPYTAPSPARHPLLMALPIYDMGLFAEDGLHGETRNVVFRNIAVLTDSPDVGMPCSSFHGLDAAHTVSDVFISGVTFNGRPVTDAESMRLSVGPYCDNVFIEGIKV